MTWKVFFIFEKADIVLKCCFHFYSYDLINLNDWPKLWRWVFVFVGRFVFLVTSDANVKVNSLSYLK